MELKLKDATKEELIQYFFQPDCFGGGFRIPAQTDEFLLWLQRKRTKELMDASDAAASESHDYLQTYIDLVKKMNTEPDVSKKLEIADAANKAWNKWQKADARQQKMEKKLDASLGI